MSIRDELLSSGYSEEDIDLEAEKEYMEVLENLQAEAERKREVLRNTLCTNSIERWADRTLRRLAWRLYNKKQSKNKTMPEFTGDRNNPLDVVKYNLENGIMPVETIDHKDGTFTHIYDDGTKVIARVTLTGIIDENMIKNAENRRKRLLADYLHMDEEEVMNMSEEEIESLVKKNELNEKIRKVLKMSQGSEVKYE